MQAYEQEGEMASLITWLSYRGRSSGFSGMQRCCRSLVRAREAASREGPQLRGLCRAQVCSRVPASAAAGPAYTLCPEPGSTPSVGLTPEVWRGPGKRCSGCSGFPLGKFWTVPEPLVQPTRLLSAPCWPGPLVVSFAEISCGNHVILVNYNFMFEKGSK